jgi:hypothetical protein
VVRGDDFSEDFLVLRGFLDPKPYWSTARSEKSRRDKKDPKSIFLFIASQHL